MLSSSFMTAFLLIGDSDYNAHIEYVKHTDRINLIFGDIDIEKNWREAIENKLSYVIKSNEKYTITLYFVLHGFYDIFADELKGKEIIDKYWNTLKECDGFKLKLSKEKGKSITYIFIKD